jgi:hypothetical protein
VATKAQAAETGAQIQTNIRQRMSLAAYMLDVIVISAASASRQRSAGAFGYRIQKSAAGKPDPASAAGLGHSPEPATSSDGSCLDA